jgi:serine/threonine protein kinase
MSPARVRRFGDGQPFCPRPDDSRTRLGVYEVTAQIGEGGMGQVYWATDTKLKRQVAIKILPRHLRRTPSGWRAFSAKRMCSSADSGQAAVRAIVMELVEAGAT